MSENSIFLFECDISNICLSDFFADTHEFSFHCQFCAKMIALPGCLILVSGVGHIILVSDVYLGGHLVTISEFHSCRLYVPSTCQAPVGLPAGVARELC